MKNAENTIRGRVAAEVEAAKSIFEEETVNEVDQLLRVLFYLCLLHLSRLSAHTLPSHGMTLKRMNVELLIQTAINYRHHG